jgi:hypothetical protein
MFRLRIDRLPIISKACADGNGDFNYLIIILTLPLTCEPRLLTK